MFAPSQLREIKGRVRAYVVDLEPEDVPVVYAAQVFEDLVTIERLAASAKTLIARGSKTRAGIAVRAAGRRPSSSPRPGTSISAAKRMLETSKQVAEQPIVSDAMRPVSCRRPRRRNRGGGDGGARHRGTPGGEGEDVHVCGVAQRMLGGSAQPVIVMRIMRGSPRTATRGTGSAVTGPGDSRQAARPKTGRGSECDRADRRRDLQRRPQNDKQEPRNAYAFDALIASSPDPGGTEKPTKAKPRFNALLRLDYDGLVRGDVEGEEICEIAGLGPIPVRVARDLLGEAILKLVITKGVDVINVTHLGRQATAAQRVALWWRYPSAPAKGARPVAVQIDHRGDWAKTHHTRYDDLDRLCEADHDLKTRHGWALIAGTGRRPMVPPDDPRHPKNKPKPNL